MTDDKNKDWFNQVMQFIDDYCKIVVNGLYKRWDKYKIQIYEAETSEAIGGLLSRQATLSIELAKSPSIWNGHVAPLILRSMTDAHIALSWILKEPNERAKKYILYGLGQEKLYIEHLKSNRTDSEDADEKIDQMIRVREEWLNSQRSDFLIEVNVGSWAGINTRDMAKEADCEDLYKFAYMPFSGGTHNMWQHISIYNLKQCHNPLHKYHRVPTIFSMKSDPDFVYRSAKYVSKSYRIFDETFNIEIDVPSPVAWFEEKFEKLLSESSDE